MLVKKAVMEGNIQESTEKVNDMCNSVVCSRPDPGQFLPYVDHARGMYRYYQECIPKNTQSVQWKIVECPKQPSGHLCGYYVLNYIRDIIQFIQANNGAEIDDLSQCFPLMEDNHTKTQRSMK